MNKKTQTVTAYLNKVNRVSFCGKTVAWQLELDGTYLIPRKGILPKEGEHDHKECKNCQKTLKQLTLRLQNKFDGKDKNPPFPGCCEHHKGLLELKEFNRKDFLEVPKMTAEKIIWTNQHIINTYKQKDWYEDITDFITANIDTFGQMPNACGEPLYRGDYLFYVKDLIQLNDEFEEEKKLRLVEFIDSFFDVKRKTETTDLNILVKTYETWFKTFPFDLSFFAHLKNEFSRKIPVLKSQPKINRYSGATTIQMHTKGSLIEWLVGLTNDIITKINALNLYEKGLLTEPDKISLEIILNERLLKLKQGYTNNSTDPSTRYRNILKEWLKDEKEFIKEITPLIKDIGTAQGKKKDKSATKSATTDLIHKHFDRLDKNGWKYAFKSETDFNSFVQLLTDFFEYKDIRLPEEVISLKRNTKTRLAKTLREIHGELSENQLRSDHEFLDIVRTLSHFNIDDDLYKTLTR